MKLQLIIENAFTGPLAHRRTRRDLEALVDAAVDLDDLDRLISQRMAGSWLGTYRGGRHLAIHPMHRGKFASGSERVAIIKE